MKHKILAALLAAGLIGTLGTAPVFAQANPLDNIKAQLQSKGIVISGTVTSMEELKQKLEGLGIDCSNPNWIEIIIPGFPGSRPENPEIPENPDENEPETPENPDDNRPEIPENPGENEPETPENPDDNQPEIPENPGENEPETPENPDDNQPEIPESPDNNKPGTPDSPDDNPGAGEDSENADFVQQVVNLVNKERGAAGLSPVTADTKVQAAAQVRAKEIEKSFAHTRPDGSSFSTALTQQGVSYRGSGENIAWGQKTPEQVMQGWMNSEGHRANILNKNFTTIGVGYYQNAAGTNYWTQLFTY